MRRRCCEGSSRPDIARNRLRLRRRWRVQPDLSVPLPRFVVGTDARVGADMSHRPCPFCGSTEITENHWHTDDGEIDSVECSQCLAGAPADIWDGHRHHEVQPDFLSEALYSEDGSCRP